MLKVFNVLSHINEYKLNSAAPLILLAILQQLLTNILIYLITQISLLRAINSPISQNLFVFGQILKNPILNWILIFIKLENKMFAHLVHFRKPVFVRIVSEIYSSEIDGDNRQSLVYHKKVLRTDVE